MVNDLYYTGFKNTGLFAFLSLLTAFIMPLSAIGDSWPAPPDIDSKSWAIIDARSGQIVAEHNSGQELPPASLTKMMTMYLAFEAIQQGRLNINDKVNVSTKAWKIGGSTMFLEPRLKPSVEQLLHGIATLSGNDACIALAEYIDGSEEAFARRMNKKAAELGLKHSHFVNATGFPMEGHYSSAMDMAMIGAALWRDFPEQYKLFGEKEYTFDKHTQPNRNRLLWSFPGADGIKTGHTREAGYCLVGSAEKDNTRFVTAVFGTKSDHARAQQTQTLLKFSFVNFVTLRPTERDIRRKVEVFEGTEDHVWVKPAAPVWVTVPKGRESSLSFRLRYDAPLKAEIKKGQNLGSIDAILGGKKDDAIVLKSIAMAAVRDVERASWFGRQWDGLRLWGRSTIKGFLADSEAESK
jgi:D-alanyl-D-alanine carboxypeptidase (penicillin-binding protein 5/6)